MNALKLLALPIVIALTGCATDQPWVGSARLDPTAGYCEDSKANVVPCEIRVVAKAGVVSFTPDELHVHRGPVTIAWILDRNAYEFQPALRDGVYFKNAEADGGPFENGHALDPAPIIASGAKIRRAAYFSWDDSNPALPNGVESRRFDYAVFFREVGGKPLQSNDPPIINHGNH
jgi:hypothetical protein